MYDTVNHRILIQKICNTTRDSPLCRVIQNMLSSRRLYVELNTERSRWRNQKNGLPDGSVILYYIVLFNIYTNDLTIWNAKFYLCRRSLYHNPGSILHRGRREYRRCTGENHAIEWLHLRHNYQKDPYARTFGRYRFVNKE